MYKLVTRQYGKYVDIVYHEDFLSLVDDLTVITEVLTTIEVLEIASLTVKEQEILFGKAANQDRKFDTFPKGVA